MKANKSLLVVGLFTIAGVVTVSCGGSSDNGNTNSAAGTNGTAGTHTTAGNSSSAGTTNGTGGSNAAGANNNGGGRPNTAGSPNNNSGGAFDFPGAGGAGFTVPSCPTGTANGAACTAMQGQNACQLNDTTYCGCRGQNNPTWTCVDTTNLPGAGGAGTGFPQATCPANAMNGDDCSNGPGLCPGQQCACGPNNKVVCL